MAQTRIFINYRREDAAKSADRIYQRLVETFGPQIFLDQETILPGQDFVKRIEETIAHCKVLLVVIGPSWLSLGKLRIHNQNDLLVHEIKVALRLGLTVIPLLVKEASMPCEADLPESLSHLAGRYFHELADESFESDLDKLIPPLKAASIRPVVTDFVASEIRQAIISALSTKYPPLVNFKSRSGAMYCTVDQLTRVVVMVEHKKLAGNFFYSYIPEWDDFLAAAERGVYVLGCCGKNEAFAIPFDWLAKRRRADRSRHPIDPRPDATGELFLHLENGQPEPLRQFAIALSSRSATA